MVLLLLSLVSSLDTWVFAIATKSQPPHLILIVADDLGRADVGTADPTVISPVVHTHVFEFILFMVTPITAMFIGN